MASVRLLYCTYLNIFLPRHVTYTPQVIGNCCSTQQAYNDHIEYNGNLNTTCRNQHDNLNHTCRNHHDNLNHTCRNHHDNLNNTCRNQHDNLNHTCRNHYNQNNTCWNHRDNLNNTCRNHHDSLYDSVGITMSAYTTRVAITMTTYTTRATCNSCNHGNMSRESCYIQNYRMTINLQKCVQQDAQSY